MKKIVFTIGVFIVVLGGVYLYSVRQTEPPSDDVVRDESGRVIDVSKLGEGDLEDVIARIGEEEYKITSGSAEFRINELFNGELKQVIGKTELVFGTINIDESDLAVSGFGVIRANARDFKTDNTSRDNAVRRFILHTDEFEFIGFKPTKILGLEGGVKVGEKIVFTLVGDLQIQKEIRPAAFDVEATFTDENTLEIRASGRIRYKEFGLKVPEVPFITDVSDDVFLVITFVAEKE